MLIGDATLKYNLQVARCHYADEVFVVTGSDEANLDIAANIVEIRDRDLSLSSTIPEVHVHLKQMRLERILGEWIEKPAREPDPDHPSAKSKERWGKKLIAFNPLQESIRILFDDHVISRRPRNVDEVAHYIVVGFGNTGQSLAIFLAENAHFSNLKRARMTIVYSQEEARAVDRFQSLYPKFFPPANDASTDAWSPDPAKDAWNYNVERVDVPTGAGPNESPAIDWARSKGVEFAVNGGFVLMEGGVTSPDFVNGLHPICLAPQIRPIVFLCNNNDEENCAEAIELRHVMDEKLKTRPSDNQQKTAYMDPSYEVSLFAYVPDHTSLARLLNASSLADQPDLIAWGDCQTSCVYDRLKANVIPQLAEAIQSAYSPPESPTKRLSLTRWQIDSNRKAAIHLNTKLSVFGIQVFSPPATEGEIKGFQDVQSALKECVGRMSGNPSPASDEKLKEQILIAAKMEHHRYMAERLLQDWALGPKPTKIEPETRQRPCFFHWDLLNQDDQDKTREQVEASITYLPRLLASSGSVGVSINDRKGEKNEANRSNP